MYSRCIPGQANILQRREDEVYVHYIGTDKRMDEWVPEDSVKSLDGEAEDRDTGGPSSSTNGRKRKRAGTNKSRASSRHRSLDIPHDLEGLGLGDEGVPMTEEEYDIQHHKQITAQRNFDKVYFAHFQIKTWYVPHVSSICGVHATHWCIGTSPRTPLPNKKPRTLLHPHPPPTPPAHPQLRRVSQA